MNPKERKLRGRTTMLHNEQGPTNPLGCVLLMSEKYLNLCTDFNRRHSNLSQYLILSKTPTPSSVTNLINYIKTFICFGLKRPSPEYDEEVRKSLTVIKVNHPPVLPPWS